MIAACFCGHVAALHHPEGCKLCHGCKGFRDATSEHTAELYDLAETGLRMAKKDLERSGQVLPIFIYRLPDGAMKQHEIPGEYGNLMNYGKAKDAIFGFFREGRIKANATATIFITDAWMGRSTPKGMGLPDWEYEALTKTHGVEDLAEMGLVEKTECASVCAQTEKWVVLLSQAYDRFEKRRQIIWREVTLLQFPQSTFVGRQKMFGCLRPENLS
jgi:hypothetical protein